MLLCGVVCSICSTSVGKRFLNNAFHRSIAHMVLGKLAIIVREHGCHIYVNMLLLPRERDTLDVICSDNIIILVYIFKKK